MALPLLAVAGGGALLSGLGSMMGQSAQNRAAGNVQNMLSNAWQPVSTQTGAAQASYDPTTGQFTTGLTGTAADYQNQLFSQAMAQPSGQGQQFLTQGQGMLNQAAGMQPIDVQGLAGEQNQLLQSMLQPGQDQAQGGMLASLMASGRLGSSGGAGQMGALTQAQSMQDLQAAQQALGEARSAASLQNQIQQGMFGQGMQLAGFGQGMTQQDLMNQLAMGQQATGMFGLENQAAATAQGLGQTRLGATQAMIPSVMSQGASPFGAMLSGLGGGMLQRGLTGMFGG